MEYLALAVALSAAGATLAAAHYARKSNRIAILADFLREFREMEPQRRRVLMDLPSETGMRLSALPEPLRADATQVCFYLDGLGLLIREGLVGESPVYSILGRPILRNWEKLSPYIEAEREARHEERYLMGFEDLAEGARHFDYELDLAKMRRYGGQQ